MREPYSARAHASLGQGVGCEGAVEDPVALTTGKQGLLDVSRTFAVVADARVEGTQPTRNFGMESALRTDGEPRYESFLRFEVSGLSGPVLRAKLRLYATDAT